MGGYREVTVPRPRWRSWFPAYRGLRVWCKVTFRIAHNQVRGPARRWRSGPHPLPFKHTRTRWR